MSAAKSGNQRYSAPDFAEPVIGRASARPIGADPSAHQDDARLGRVLIKHAVPTRPLFPPKADILFGDLHVRFVPNRRHAGKKKFLRM
jgi:hypothetical protein